MNGKAAKALRRHVGLKSNSPRSYEAVGHIIVVNTPDGPKKVQRDQTVLAKGPRKAYQRFKSLYLGLTRKERSQLEKRSTV